MRRTGLASDYISIYVVCKMRHTEPDMNDTPDARRQTRPTLSDIARVVGVSEATVSRALRGNLEISPRLEQSDRMAFNQLVEERSAEAPYCDRRIHVSWTVGRNDVTVVVKDDGTGFDPAATGNRDENVDYYVAKLDDLMKKFSSLSAAASTPKQETLAL